MLIVHFAFSQLTTSKKLISSRSAIEFFLCPGLYPHGALTNLFLDCFVCSTPYAERIRKPHSPRRIESAPSR